MLRSKTAVISPREGFYCHPAPVPQVDHAVPAHFSRLEPLFDVQVSVLSLRGGATVQATAYQGARVWRVVLQRELYILNDVHIGLTLASVAGHKGSPHVSESLTIQYYHINCASVY